MDGAACIWRGGCFVRLLVFLKGLIYVRRAGRRIGPNVHTCHANLWRVP